MFIDGSFLMWFFFSIAIKEHFFDVKTASFLEPGILQIGVG